MEKLYKTIWRPQPKQALALSCPATELFFGGAAGGGKSDFLLADFLQGAAKYGRHWRAVLFRQTFPQLEELQLRARELFAPIGGKFSHAKSMWTFPNGATLKLRHLENDKACENYQGHQYTWIGIDELGNYPSAYVWEFMLSRLRSAAGVLCTIRGTANPGGVGHAWLKHRFIDGAVPNRIQKIAVTLPSGRTAYTTRVFIPSRLEDNPALTEKDVNYEANLMSLPEHLRRALRFGDWNVFAGQIFSEFSAETHVVKPFALGGGLWFKFCAMDWGYEKPYAIGWFAVNGDGEMVMYRELYGCPQGEMNVGTREAASKVAEKAYSLSVADGVTCMVADPAIWQRDNGREDSRNICDCFTEAGFKMVKANNDRVNGLVVCHEYLTTTGADGKPMFRLFPTCTEWIRTVPMLTPSPTHPEDVDTRLEDHLYDMWRYACMSEYAKAPGRALQIQNGSWRRAARLKSYNPLDRI